MNGTATSAKLADKVVLITGATGQVGWGIAHAAIDAGATVVLPVRSEAGRAEIEANFGSRRASAVIVDFADEGSLVAMREATLKRLGSVDHVIAPLGPWWQKGLSLNQPAAELHSLMSAYVEAQWLLVKTFAPALRASRGSYTFITGAAGETDYIPGAGLLVVAVKAQLALSDVLRRELAHESFRINEIRISRRIERAPRPGVIASRVSGATLLEAVELASTGKLLRYEGAQLELDDQAF